MRNFKAGLFLGTFLCTGLLFASCPQVGNYTLRSHDPNNNNCSYASNKTIKLSLNSPKPPTANCPRFILTDPNYHLLQCGHEIRTMKCVCNITHN